MVAQALSTLSLGELSLRAQETEEELSAWRALGLIGAPGSLSFSLDDVELARLVRFCLRRGFGVDAIVNAERAEPGFLRHYLDQILPPGARRSVPLRDVPSLTGLDAELARRLLEGPGPRRAGDAIHEDDVEVLRGWRVALENGLPEEALLQLVRVYGDALSRVAEAEARLFHFYVHERLRNEGLSVEELHRRTEAASQPMRRLIEPALLYYHRRGMGNALCEDMLLHLAEHSGSDRATDSPARLWLAVAFVDLASFTPLVEAMGDEAAARVVARFSDLVREIVNHHEGKVVERIGDSFLLVFPAPERAVGCVLEIRRRAARESQFPALRGGIHFGPVLYREGGYVGANINLASRIAGEARRDQFLVSAEVARDAGRLAWIEFAPAGKRRLKGVADEVELFEARDTSAPDASRVTDPVCGMELTRDGIAARLSLGSRELAFCSENCLRVFVERS